MREHIRLRRNEEMPSVLARVAAMSVLLLVTIGALWWQSKHPPGVAPTVLVEVRGDVPTPGFHALSPPATLYAALRAAGMEPTDQVDASLAAGTRVEVEGGKARLVPMDEMLVVGLPLSLNQASAAALDTLPGIGPSLAAAIVADRQAKGPFPDVDALNRVKGIGPKTVEELRPFLVADR